MGTTELPGNCRQKDLNSVAQSLQAAIHPMPLPRCPVLMPRPTLHFNSDGLSGFIGAPGLVLFQRASV